MSHSKDTIRCWDLNISRLQTSFPVSPGVGIWDSEVPFGIVWLGLVRMLHFDGGQQELCRVEVIGPLHQLDVAKHVGVECILVFCTIYSASSLSGLFLSLGGQGSISSHNF